jgi:MFS family permease
MVRHKLNDMNLDDPEIPPRPRSPLGYPQFRELWTANAASNFGSQIQVVGAGWLMATLVTSPQVIALVQTAINLPTVLFILLGGALADNFDRRRILLVTQSAMLVTASLLAALTWTGHIGPWSLLLLVFIVSAFGSLSNPCWQATVRDVLPRDMISRAVALNSTSINLARTAGPALGGAIVSLAGVATAFLANAISFTGFLVAVVRWKPVRQPRTAPREPVLHSMLGGARYALREPNVRNAVVRGGLSGISASTVFALLPVVARQQMSGDVLLYGFLLAAFGGGAVCSALSGGWLRAHYPPECVVRLATAMMASGLLLIGFAPAGGAIALGAALGGGGWTLAHSTYNTTVQLSAARWVTGRSLAFYQTATFAGMATGSVLFGWVATHWGVSEAFVIAGTLHGTSGLIGLALPLPRYDTLHTEPLDRWHAPVPVFDVVMGDGPVRVDLEYRIAPENVAAFRQAMQVRAVIRRRDGALNWTLWRDTGDAELWLESYRVRDWAEYLRHNARRTQADGANVEALDALTRDGSGPVVRRIVGTDNQ